MIYGRAHVYNSYQVYVISVHMTIGVSVALLPAGIYVATGYWFNRHNSFMKATVGKQHHPINLPTNSI